MTADGSSWLIVASCLFVAWWTKQPPPVATPIAAHELAPVPSCDSELRLLLDARAQAEHYRLLLIGAAGLLALLLVVILCLTACLLGCCAWCRTAAPAPAAVAPPKKADPALLALLALQEVRR